MLVPFYNLIEINQP